jgi:hypothetical protein
MASGVAAWPPRLYAQRAGPPSPFLRATLAPLLLDVLLPDCLDSPTRQIVDG